MRFAAVSQRSCQALARLLQALCTGPENPPTGCSHAWVPQKLHTEFDNASCLSSYLMVALSATISQVPSWVSCSRRLAGCIVSLLAWCDLLYNCVCAQGICPAQGQSSAYTPVRRVAPSYGCAAVWDSNFR